MSRGKGEKESLFILILSFLAKYIVMLRIPTPKLKLSFEQGSVSSHSTYNACLKQATSLTSRP